jgi:hypothetical protein
MINIGNYSFEGPYSNVGYLQNRSGVYVILSASNHVVDVGESATVKDRIENHDRKFCWQRHGGSQAAVLYTPNRQQSGRMLIEQELRRKYAPPCGKR